MSRRNRPAVPDDSSRDLKRQEGIFLSTFALMLLVLVSSYLPLPLIVPIVLAVVLVTWTIAMYVKFHDFWPVPGTSPKTPRSQTNTPWSSSSASCSSPTWSTAP